MDRMTSVHTSWPMLSAAAEATGFTVTAGATPYTRCLQEASGQHVAEVGFSADLGWYQLGCPFVGQFPQARRLLQHDFVLARAGISGAALVLCADLPAAEPADLALSLGFWKTDCQTGAAILAGQADIFFGTTNDEANPEAVPVIEEFLDHQTQDWFAKKVAIGVWRLSRRPTALPDWPSVAQLVLVGARTTLAITGSSPSGFALPKAVVIARDLLLLRLNGSRRSTATCLTDHGVVWRAALPTRGLRPGQLDLAWRSVLATYQVSHSELQALTDEALARLYLEMYSDPNIIQEASHENVGIGH